MDLVNQGSSAHSNAAQKYKLSLSSSVIPCHNTDVQSHRVELSSFGHVNQGADLDEVESGNYSLKGKDDPQRRTQPSEEFTDAVCRFESPSRQQYSVKASGDTLSDFYESNKMGMARQLARQFAAELLGTFLLVLFGDAAIAQVVLGNPNFKGFQSICFGYGFALMIGIFASGGVSGGHLNPAVTLSMAVLRKCKWIQVPVYWLAQYLGAFLAAAVVFGIYGHALYDNNNDLVPGYEGIFASYPNGDLKPPNATLAFDQMLGTALLVVIILAVTDEKNMQIPTALYPLFIGLGLCAIHLSFGLNAGCAVNPARDLSPRLFTLIAGWSKESTFGEDSNHFFWIPWLLPHFGGVIGAFTYHGLISLHHTGKSI